MAKRPRVLVVDNSPRHLGRRWFPKALAGLPCRVSTIHPMSGGRLKSLDGFDALLIGGSPASATEDQPWVLHELELASSAAARAMPVLGACFGSQILGRVFFGRGALQAAWHPEFGWFTVQRSGVDPLFDGVPDEFTSFQFHTEEVLPRPGMHVLACNDNSKVQAFRVGDKPIWGLQFHAEVTPAAGRDFLRRTSRVYSPYGFQYEVMAVQARPNAAANLLFSNFIRAI